MLGVFMLPRLLTNFEIQKYHQNDPRFNGFYSRNNLPKIKDGAYVMNLDEFNSIATHWTALYVNGNNVTYFSSFEVEYILKQIKKFTGDKNIITNIYRIQAYYSIMCGLDLLIFLCFFLLITKRMIK